MEILTSNQNNRVKEWKKLQLKKERKSTQSYLIEGWHSVVEAVNNGAIVSAIMVVNPDNLKELPIPKDVEVYQITEEIAKHIATTKTPEGIFAVAKTDATRLTIPADLKGKWLLLDDIQDPGNIGTMVRTADAAGISGVVFGDGTADLYNPKVVRSMQGSQFHIKIFQGNLKGWIKAFKDASIPVYGTQLSKDAVSYFDADKKDQFALIMGNEGNGVNYDLLKETDQNLYIPMPGNAESLNVAVACGVILFGFMR